jgi:septal ring factor EnvC (AmiA/AmiB activator)
VKRLACLALVLSVYISGGIARAGEQENLTKLRQRIAALQQDLEKTSESKSEAADALRESERAISESNRKLAGLAQQQRSAMHALAQLQQQSALLRADMQQQQAQLSALLYRQYLEGRHEYLELLLDDRDPNQAVRDLEYYEYIARSRAAWLNTLRSNLAQMDGLSRQAQQKSAEVAALEREGASQRRDLEQDRRARQQMLVKISARLKLQNREIGRLQRNEARLSQLVEKLAQLFDRSNSSPFESLRGKLAPPVEGRISNKFGARRPDSTVPWKGWFLRASRGQEVHAIASGRVVFADWLRGFGNLLIIDHGKGYMSLYGNNETLYKEVGDTLRGGDVVATVGNSGGNEDYGLYFELRHEGNPLDPARWVAVR